MELKGNLLFSDFPETTKESWEKTAAAEIGNEKPWEKLKWERDGVIGLPYYDKTDKVNISTNLPASSSKFMGPRAWYNLPKINVLDDKEGNILAHSFLNTGADGILFELSATSKISFPALLAGIEWPYCMVSFLLNDFDVDLLAEVENYLKENYESSSVQGFILTKTYPHHPQSLHKVVHNYEKYNHLRTLCITSNAKNPVEQICEALSYGVTYMDLLTENGVQSSVAARSIFFSVQIGTDFFLEIAKLKVLRMLWYRILEAYNTTDEIAIHAISNTWSMASFEPHENMLKGTTAGLAAVLGGCSALTIEASDENDPRLNRIARNVSSILREESHINKVADPTVGSYYLDNLVESVAKEAWQKFLKTQRA